MEVFRKKLRLNKLEKKLINSPPTNLNHRPIDHKSINKFKINIC